MAKKKKSKTPIDYHMAVFAVIPSTQEAYHRTTPDLVQRKDEAVGKVLFRKSVLAYLDRDLKDERFPTEKEVFVFIVQYLVSGKSYKTRDVDNMAKTVLDVLRGRIYEDDSQVQTLLVSKKVDTQNVNRDFVYIAIKELRAKQDIDALKVSGINRAVVLFRELESYQ